MLAKNFYWDTKEYSESDLCMAFDKIFSRPFEYHITIEGKGTHIQAEIAAILCVCTDLSYPIHIVTSMDMLTAMIDQQDKTEKLPLSETEIIAASPFITQLYEDNWNTMYQYYDSHKAQMEAAYNFMELAVYNC